MSRKSATKSAAKTRKSAKSAAKSPKSSTFADANWRVMKLAEPIRESFRAFRDEHDLTNAKTIDVLIEKQLPEIVNILGGLGIAKQIGAATRLARMPFSQASLAALKSASQETGIAAALLFRCCIGRLSSGKTSGRKGGK
jgi:hypothetical protein